MLGVCDWPVISGCIRLELCVRIGGERCTRIRVKLCVIWIGLLIREQLHKRIDTPRFDLSLSFVGSIWAGREIGACTRKKWALYPNKKPCSGFEQGNTPSIQLLQRLFKE